MSRRRRPASDHPLHGASLKIERAKKHIQDTEALLRQFYDTDPYGRGFYEDPHAKTVTVKMHPKSGPLLELAILAAGDAIHNLRSALDHVAYQLAMKQGITDKGFLKKVTFPICDTREGFECRSNRTKIKRLGRGVLGAMRALRPYKRGNPLLWALHHLDIIDKHRNVVGIGHRRVQIKTSVVSGRITHREIESRWQTFKKDIKLYTQPFPHKPSTWSSTFDPNNNIGVTFDVTLGEVEAVKARGVVEGLNELTKLVSHIVAGFLPYF